VSWRGEVSRDSLSATTRNSLGAISTVFLVPPEAERELEGGGNRPLDASLDTVVEPEATVEAGAEDLFSDTRNRGLEFIRDKISRLDPDDFEHLVAGLLRAMGYKTRVSPKGPDRGFDILASPDGLGFEQPRIVVECKHRAGRMGAPEVRSFLGGRHTNDRGLYVSTGGFSKDARYEADRASIPLMLMDGDDLVEAVVEYYESFDSATRSLLPLGRIYWPV
jgi:restriction system protein